MLDTAFKSFMSPFTQKRAERISQSGLTAAKLVLLALVIGLVACFTTALQIFPLSIILILVCRFLAGMAAALDQGAQSNHLAAYLAPLCDYTFFGAFAFFFTLAMPEHSMAAAFLVFSYLVMGMTYLSQIIVYDRMAVAEQPRSGLVETTEITIFMIICCLYPPGFSAFAALFALLCCASAIWRMAATLKLLKS